MANHTIQNVEFECSKFKKESLRMVDNTQSFFSDKWRFQSDFQMGGVAALDKQTLDWIIERNGWGSLENLRDFLQQFQVILDAGCGNGRILRLFADLVQPSQNLLGIDYASAEVAAKNLAGVSTASIRTVDLMSLEEVRTLGSADFIYCQEVLHHTRNPARAFRNLVDILSDEGEIAIYVYLKKAPIREFVDDFVRNQMGDMSFDVAFQHATQFSAFGEALARLDIQVEVPAVDLLQIPAGKIDLQRLIYYYFMKCFWRKSFTQEANTLTNLDWYMPTNASRHTLDEVLGWVSSAQLSVVWQHVDGSGVTVRARKI